MRLRTLSEGLSRRMDALVAEVGQVGDARLLVMLNLLLLDEIEELRDAISPGATGQSGEERTAEILNSVAARIEALAARLEEA